jgi:hypothetical protein
MLLWNLHHHSFLVWILVWLPPLYCNKAILDRRGSFDAGKKAQRIGVFHAFQIIPQTMFGLLIIVPWIETLKTIFF